MVSNNHIFAFALCAAAALACIGLPWGTVTIRNEQGMAAMLNGVTATISGTNGSFSVLGIPLPTWLISVLSAVAVVTAGLNAKGVLTFPRYAPLIAIGALLLVITTCLVVLASNGSIGVGPVVITLALLVSGGIYLTATDRAAHKPDR